MSAAKTATKQGYGLMKETVSDFVEDDCMSSGAALAYYTIFSLPPILLIVLTLAGWGIEQAGRAGVQGMDQEQLRKKIAEQTALEPETIQQVQEMAKNPQQSGGGPLSIVIGIAVLLFSATGALAQLQAGLNRAWEVQPDPEQGGIKNFLMKRALSLGMILVVAFLVLVSVAVTTVLSTVGNMILPANLPGPLMMAINNLVSLLIMTLLFAAIFKVLPDADVTWKSVWVGAAFTAVLFVIGKFLIGLYLSMSSMGDTYGAAGTLVLVLVWVYYSSLIVLLGAEFTQAWARRYGERIVPSKGAVRVVRDTREVRDAGEHGMRGAAGA